MHLVSKGCRIAALHNGRILQKACKRTEAKPTPAMQPRIVTVPDGMPADRPACVCHMPASALRATKTEVDGKAAELNNAIALDCEMVGVGDPKLGKRRSAVAR